MEIQKLFVTLALKSGEFTEGMQQAAGKAREFGGRIGDSLKQIGTMAVAGAAVAGAAMAGIGAAIVSLAANAAPIAGIQASFDSLTASMEGGSAAMLSALQDASGGLITNTDLMQSFNTAASLVSKDFAEQLPDAMGYLSKVAAATGQDMNFMLDSLVKGVGRLSPMILDNLGIQVNLAEANEIYAASIGKSVDELTKAEQQTALMNQVLVKLAENTEGMEGMSNPFEQFKITMANLKDEIGVRLLPVVAPLMEKFGELAQRVIPMLMPMVEGFIERLSGVTAALETVVGVIGSFISNLESGMSPLDAFISAVSGIIPPEALTTLIDFRDNILPGLSAKFTEIKDRVIELVAPIADAIAQFVSWKDVLIAVAIGIAAIVLPAIWSIITAMAPIILIVGAVIGVVALLRNAWESNWGGIQEKTAAAWAFVQPILAAVVEWVGTQVKAAIESLRTFWVDTAWPAIKTAVAVAWPVIQTIFNAIKTFIVDLLIPTLQALWQKWTQDVWPVIQTVTQNVWTVIKAIFEELGRWINDNIAPWIEFLKNKFEEDWKKIQNAVDAMWQFVKPIWEAIREWAADKLPPVMNALRSVFDSVMGGIRSAVQPVRDIWDGFVGAVQGFWDWIKGKVFNFSINLPDLPDWAIPGSPLPIHTAWKAFAEDMEKFGGMDNGGHSQSLKQSVNNALTVALSGGGGAALSGGRQSVDNSRRSTNYGGIHIYGEARRRSPLELLEEMK